MAFFEDLERTLSDAGAKTLQKTKEFTDTTRLNGLISEEESQINNMYWQIGKTYVSLYKGNPDENLAGFIAAIDASEKKIVDYKHRIAEIKGVRSCPNCGNEVPQGASFCNACGTPMPKPPVPEGYVLCANCGAPVAQGMRFCANCGAPQPEAAQAATAPQEPAQAPAAEQTATPAPTQDAAAAEAAIPTAPAVGEPAAPEQNPQ